MMLLSSLRGGDLDILNENVGVIRVNQASKIEDIKSLLQLFTQVANEQGWEPGDQLFAYTSSSVYFVIMMDERLIGGLQLVLGGTDGIMPYLTVWPELKHASLEKSADVALIAILPEYRGKLRLFWLLLVELWRYCAANDIERLWMEITPRTLRLYQRLGWPLAVAGSLRHHWGEECHPCSVSVKELERVFNEKARLSSMYHDFVSQAYRDQPVKLNAQGG